MIYFTFNDAYSGVYASQVIDVCQYLNKELGIPIRLVAIQSLKGYKRNRGKIKAALPNAIVLPMVPFMGNWRWNFVLLAMVCLFLPSRFIIGRGVFAASIALKIRKLGLCKKVGFDGRGAYSAEWQEYNIVNDSRLKKMVLKLEKKVVTKADYRLAVSKPLTSYWKEEYSYRENEHVIIPCTLREQDIKNDLNETVVQQKRAAMGYRENDIVLIYSGSTAGWQSFGLLDTVFTQLLHDYEDFKLLFLSKPDKLHKKLEDKFNGRVQVEWVEPDKVFDYLSIGDYGILIRDDCVTNRVSAPTKFAEYLNAGLMVLISPHIGDYSDFVRNNACGHWLSNDESIQLHLTVNEFENKQRIRQLAAERFSKNAYKKEYEQMMTVLSMEY